MSKLETQKEIKEPIDRRDKDMKETSNKMEKVVKDKKAVKKLADELKLTTTREGVERMKKEVTEAAAKTEIEFDDQNEKLKRKIDECNKSNQQLDEKTSAAKENMDRIDGTKGQIQQTRDVKGELDQARKVAESDKHFTETERNNQERFKNERKRQRDDQENQMKSIRLPF